MRRFVAVLAALAAAAAAQAQPYPNRPITMIVPFPPGGIADITARPLAVSMAKMLGQNVVVENKAGAGGAVGHAYVAKARPDGYTIMTALSSIVVIPEADKVNGRPSTYQMSEFAPIALVSADPTILLVPADSPWKTLKELVDDARSRPGKISYASSGVYGTIHTCFEMLAQAADVRFLHVPYKGGGPAMTALIAGEVNLGAQSPGVANPHLRSGKIRTLGSWAASRTSGAAGGAHDEGAGIRRRVLHLGRGVRAGGAAARGGGAAPQCGAPGGAGPGVQECDDRHQHADQLHGRRGVRPVPRHRHEAPRGGGAEDGQDGVGIR